MAKVKVVGAGSVKVRIDGSPTTGVNINPGSVIDGGQYAVYNGPYEASSGSEDRVLPTAHKILGQNIVVHPARHPELVDRDAPDQHSIGAITGLSQALADKQDALTAGENILIEDGVISATVGGASSWDDLTDKPFDTIDDNTLIVRDGVLAVNTTDVAEQDNTKPITSSGVHVIVGNIDTLLSLI